MIASQQRVADSVAHRSPDRIPIDFGATAVSGIHVTVVDQLRRHFGLERRPVKVHEPYQMLGFIDEDLQQAMRIDTQGVYRRNNMFGIPNRDWRSWDFNGLEVLVPGQFNTSTAPNGDTLIHPEGDLAAPPSARMPKGGFFFDSIIRQNHFDPDHLDPADNLEEFAHLTPAELDEIETDVRAAHSTGRYVVAGFGGAAFGDIALVPGPGMKDPRGIRDVEEWYVTTASRRDYVHTVFARQCEIAIANLERIHARVGSLVHALFLCGTDFGTQTSAFCSTASFRNLWLPYYQAVCGWIHSNTTWKCFKHSCGSVDRFIPSFIEAGFDILNPVQCSATGMEPSRLKSDFGAQITFWGGGADTQHTLPFGTPDEVRAEVLSRCETLGRDGGFVFNTIHNIQAGTPLENVVAMLDAVNEFNGVH